MGKASREKRERRERAALGITEDVRQKLANPVSRAAIKVASHKSVVEELSAGTVDQQTQRLNTLVGEGTLSASKLAQAIMKKAPAEMDKGIKKLQRQGQRVTVEALLSEVRTEPGFLSMCQRVGITYEWFERLAETRMAALNAN